MKSLKPIELAEKFNRDHKVGTPVKYWIGARRRDREGRDLDGGSVSKTASEAFVVGGHSAVVMIDGVSGCVAISHVKAITKSEVAA